MARPAVTALHPTGRQMTPRSENCSSAKPARKHCIEQKEMFGASFKYVPYVECAVKGSREMTPECKAAGTKNFPSWQFNGGALHEGVLSIEDLSARSACPLPQ